jgi:hypothetical protein
MKQLIAFVALFVASQYAGALEIINARTDAASQTMVLTVWQTTCSKPSARLMHLYSNKRIDGPHFFNLDVFHTDIGCPRIMPKIVDIQVKIPPGYGNGDSLVIRNAASEALQQILSFRLTRPLRTLPIAVQGLGPAAERYPAPPEAKVYPIEEPTVR